MSGAEQAVVWLSIGLAIGALVAAVAMLRSRSLFVMAVSLAAALALGSAALVLLNGGDGALAMAVVGVGLAPFVLMSGLLLGGRTAKPAPRWAVVFGVAAAAAGGMVGVLIAPELSAAPRASAGSVDGLMIGALIVVASAACAGLLGYGERGVLERRGTDR